MDKPTVIISLSNMGFRIGVDKKGIIKGCSLPIFGYSKRFEQWERDKETRSWKLLSEFYHFDSDQEVAYFPRYDVDEFKKFLEEQGVSFTEEVLPPVEGSPVSFLMLPHIEYKSEIQKNAVDYLSNEDSGSIRGLALQTGQGKDQPLYSTVLTDNGWVRMGSVSLDTKVVTPDGELVSVTGIYPQGVKEVYRITLESGRTVDCGIEHLWNAYCGQWENEFDVVSLKTIGDTEGDVFIPVLGTLDKIVGIDYVGQHETQCISIDHPDQLYITDNYIVTHNTVAYMWSLQKLGVRSMTTMTTRLDQWKKELVTKTTLEEDDIFVIAGVASLTKLFTRIDDLKPKLILASTQTIRRYLDYAESYQHLPHPSEMCEKLGIGVVGTDEYHEHFFTNFLIGIILNPKLFIPITATFLASDPFTKEVFNKFIPENIQFKGGEYKKYVNITAYNYNAGGPFLKPFHYMSPKGYSQQIFEKNLVTRLSKYLDRIIDEAIIPMVEDHYIRIADPGEKFLFLCSSVKLCDHLVTVFKRRFPDKKVTAFHSGMPSTILDRYDMIFSTPGSAGTGRDIPNLRTCFAFESSFSEIRNLQFLGRLRDFPSVKNTPEFIYLQLRALPPHTNHAIKRSMLYGPRALTFKHRTI